MRHPANFVAALAIHQLEQLFSPEGSDATILQFISSPEKLDLIISHSKTFAPLQQRCQQPDLEGYWQSVCQTLAQSLPHYGLATSEGFALFSHPTGNFQHACGLYYFTQALIAKQTTGTDFGLAEIAALQEAITHGSIHALQRYHQHLYANLPQEGPEQQYAALAQITQQCRSMVKSYGSYALIMLAETQLRSATLLATLDKKPEAVTHFTAAVKSCKQAIQHLQASQASIHNASFGKDLGASNSLGITTAEDMQQYITSQGSALGCSPVLITDFFRASKEKLGRAKRSLGTAFDAVASERGPAA